MTRIGLCAALLAATALTACGGGGGGGESSDGISRVYRDSFLSQEAILKDPAIRDQLDTNGRPIPDDLPASGSATFAGFGQIFDASLTGNETRASQLRNRSVVSDLTGTVDFASGVFNVRQSNFRDVDGASVPGQVDWTLTRTNVAITGVSVTGNVGGTIFTSSNADASFYGELSNSVLVGELKGATISNPGQGWMQGTAVKGDFAARGTGQ